MLERKVTIKPPIFFSAIRDEAKARWEKLEADPKMAGPWWQLFMQVKSPQHVLSELLQNADDAGATQVIASIEDGIFTFAHNGEDFNDQTFSSLCNFGFSNKRNLHTIGFRGIGFKSVFSLGPQVEIATPTMSFAFNERRFTEPIWIEGLGSNGDTVIRVKIADLEKHKDLEKDFIRWKKSSISLLFFKNIRELVIQNENILREDLEEGPVPGSNWVSLNNKRVLFITSQSVPFPQDCIDEIRQERGMENLADDMPPCSVQIVFGSGLQPYLYTVLPTEIRPLIPFSVNAPFMTDPARIKLKSLSSSPTNRWLLKRIGQLAADSIIAWIENERLDLTERARAYALLPDQIRDDGSLERACSVQIIDAMRAVFDAKETCVLCNDGTVTSKNKAIALPDPVLDTWGDTVALRSFAPHKERIVARSISNSSVTKLSSWGFIESRLGESFLSDIYRKMNNPPCPQPLERLTHFWRFCLSLSNERSMKYYANEIPIVPVVKRNTLFPAKSVLSTGNIDTRLTDDEWSFLRQYADFVDPEWSRMLSQTKKELKDRHADAANLDNQQQSFLDAAELYEKFHLDNTITLDRVIQNVAENIFKQENPGQDGIAIAHIAARCNVQISEGFKYLCRDGCWRTGADMLIAPAIADIDDLFPSQWLHAHVISDEYETTCPRQDLHIWQAWSQNHTKSRLYGFPIPQQSEEEISGRDAIENIIKRRGGMPPSQYEYAGDTFILTDYDWEPDVWSFWNTKAQENPVFWLNIGRAIISWYSKKWEGTDIAIIKQKAKKHAYRIQNSQVCSAWLMRIRGLRCLPDVYGTPMTPAELMRTTPDTGPLSSVERFIHKDLDKPEYAEILELLGVRGKPEGIAPLLDRLQAISRSENPPISHLGNIYACIERALLRMPSEEVNSARERFKELTLIFTEDCTWESSLHVFQDNPEGIPGVSILHHEFRNSQLWDRLNVTPRPTFEMALSWLIERPVGEKLSEKDKERVRSIIRKDAKEVWSKSRAWLDLSGRWQEKNTLAWGWARNSVPSLFDSFKQRIADVSMVPGSTSAFYEFTHLIPLETALEERLVAHNPDSRSSDSSWLNILGNILMRLKDSGSQTGRTDDPSPVEYDRKVAAQMKASVLQPVQSMKVAPYINNELAGSQREGSVLWKDTVIYVKGLQMQHSRELKKVMTACFKTESARAAIEECVYREPSWILEYARLNLDLMEEIYNSRPNEKSAEAVEALEMAPDAAIEELRLTPSEDAHEAPPDENPSPQSTQNEENEGAQKPKQIHPRQDHIGNAFDAYMQGKGYFPVGEQYLNADGNIIAKAEHGSLFDWKEFNKSGQLVSQYWVTHGSIREGVDIPYEIWNYPLQENSEINLLFIECVFR